MKKCFVMFLGSIGIFFYGCNFFYIDNWEPPKKYKAILKEKIRIQLGNAKTIKVSSPGNITFYNPDDGSRLGSTKYYFKTSYDRLKKKFKLNLKNHSSTIRVLYTKVS